MASCTALDLFTQRAGKPGGLNVESGPQKCLYKAGLLDKSVTFLTPRAPFQGCILRCVLHTPLQQTKRVLARVTIGLLQMRVEFVSIIFVF